MNSGSGLPPTAVVSLEQLTTATQHLLFAIVAYQHAGAVQRLYT